MALLHLEGFDWLDTSLAIADAETLLNDRYSQVEVNAYSAGSIVTGRHGIGSALQFGDHDIQYIFTRTLHDAEADTAKAGYCGFAVKTGNAFYSSVPFFAARRVTTYQASARCTNTGTIQLYRGTSFDSDSGAKSLRNNAWYFIEFYWVIGNAPNGEMSCWVNGELWASYSGVDNQASSTLTGWDNVGIECFCNTQIIDDWYVCNTQGSYNNSRLGDINVRTLVPNGDASVAMTRSGGTTNYENVDNIPLATSAWDDTSYVESGTATTKDLYDYSALESEDASASIIGVNVCSIVRSTNPEQVSAKHKVKSGVTEVSGPTENFMWDTYNWMESIHEVDPDTSSAWTPTGVNAAQFGIEVA